MDDLNRRHDAARGAMIDAFRELSDAARWAGVDHDHITDLHGRFFDGNVELRTTFGAASILARLWCDQPPAGDPDVPTS